MARPKTNDELFQKNVYDWVGGSTIGSYFISVTSSHYDWAMKKIKAHRKMINDKQTISNCLYADGKTTDDSKGAG